MAEQKRKSENFAYGSVLEALTQGLYPDKKHVIRELVQNAYDALAELKRRDPEGVLSPIKIKVEGQSIFISDRGIGMTEQKMREYRYLGFSRKTPETDAGFRGIGKFSPISLCERIIVDSSPYGINRGFRVIIDAERMMARIKERKNPPLEDLLRESTSFEDISANKSDHYTFVELYKVRKDSRAYLELNPLKEYLRRTAPLRLDPKFAYAAELEKRLQKHVRDYLAVDLVVNGARLFKPYLEPCEAPQDEFAIDIANPDKPLAYCWSCANSDGGQFKSKGTSGGKPDAQHPDSGLVFRSRNIAIGDRFLPRRTFWKRSPELSFHYFGEIHVITSEVVPSSDRTDFEDNLARGLLYDASVAIATSLNLRRQSESLERNFDRKLSQTSAAISGDINALDRGGMPVEVRDDHAYAIQRALEDLRKRLQRSKNSRKKSKAKAVVKQGEQLLARLKHGNEQEGEFIDITGSLKFDKRMASLYNTIIGVIHDELKYDPERFEALISRIHEALRAARI